MSQKLTQQCNSTVLKKDKEKKTRNVRRIKERITVRVRRMCMYFSFSEIIRVRCGGDVKQFPGHTKTHQQRVESSLAQLNLRTTSKWKMTKKGTSRASPSKGDRGQKLGKDSQNQAWHNSGKKNVYSNQGNTKSKIRWLKHGRRALWHFNTPLPQLAI